MADPRFFQRRGPFTLAQLAEIAGAQIAPGFDPSLLLDDVSTLAEAQPGQISFLDNRKYLNDFSATKASACIIAQEMAQHAPEKTALLISKNPYKSYAKVAQAFYPAEAAQDLRHATASIDPSSSIGKNVRIDAAAVIGKNAKIGADCIIGPGAVIGDGVEIGNNCVIGANASLSHCLLSDRVVIYPGARIGQSGFGFAPDAVAPVKVPQLGRVLIESDVEVGANSTIDRGAIGDTVIGQGTMIDNLVQIGHNVKIGRCCVIVSQVGISGSTEIGDYVQIGGQAGLAGHLKIGNLAKIAAQAGVMRDVDAGETVGGTPAVPVRQWHKQTAVLSGMTKPKKTATS